MPDETQEAGGHDARRCPRGSRTATVRRLGGRVRRGGSSMARTFRGVVGVAVLLGLVPIAAAQPDPQGKPARMEKGQNARWYVWHDSDGWHLRTTTQMKAHDFSGTIQVVGGRITSVTGAKLEGRGKFNDWWQLSENDRVLTLNLRTKHGMDGVDFRVGPRADRIVVTLRIDGRDSPDQIFIGRAGSKPGTARFILSAHPER